MTHATFLGLGGYRWVALVIAGLTLLLLGDALAGHYRSGFRRWVQYLPFVSGGILVVSTVGVALAPDIAWMHRFLRVSAWAAAVSGLAGFASHQYYGVWSKPGGYRWALHYLMYGAPPLAPLALTANALFALVAARGLMGDTHVGSLTLRTALYALVGLSMTGAIVQAAILHYRGAFNNPLMYAPLTAPVGAVLSIIWIVMRPGPTATAALLSCLWATFLIGFIGLGMHLRGFDRQMGGLYVPLANWLEGPPAGAPGLFAGFALIGMTTATLL